MIKIIVFLLCSLSLQASYGENGPVSDRDSILTAKEKESAAQAIEQINKRGAYTTKFVLVRSLGDKSIEALAKNTAENWDQKQVSALFLLAIEDRKAKLHLSNAAMGMVDAKTAANIIKQSSSVLADGNYTKGAIQILTAIGEKFKATAPIIESSESVEEVEAPPISLVNLEDKEMWKKVNLLYWPLLFLIISLFRHRPFSPIPNNYETTYKEYLSTREKEEIEDKVAVVLPVVIQSSSSYGIAPMKMGVLLALSISMLLYILPFSLPPLIYIWVQVPALIIGYMIGRKPKLKRFFATNSELKGCVSMQAEKLALQHFFKDSSGVLVLISLLERRAKVAPVGDAAIKIDQHKCLTISKQITRKIRRESISEGICFAVAHIDTLLSNQMSNQVSNQVSGRISPPIDAKPEEKSEE